MDIEEKSNLTHDFANAIAILRGIAVSAANFAAELQQTNTMPAEQHLLAFVERMDALQLETDRIEQLFTKVINE